MTLPDSSGPDAVDVVVVGSGPNGLAAAAVLVEAGRSVTVLEANDNVGGGVRTAALTRPGFLHDVCSAVHPLGVASPVFERLDLEAEGLEWIHPEVPLAHPLDPVPGGAPRAVALYRDLARTADGLAASSDGRGDGRSWRRTVGWVGERSRFDRLKHELLAPLGVPGSPRAGWELTRFGLWALRPAVGFAEAKFSGERARALFAGIAAHSVLPLERLTSAAVALVLGGAAHAVGWPSPRHPERPYVLLGQQSIADPTRAPKGQHTAWAYCHVPHGSTVDRIDAIESQVERFAPGFRDVVLERFTRDTAELEAGNANLVGGDIGGGVMDLGQLFTRPMARRVPYSTPNPRIWLCSSSTPPGGGVHGMCGDHAARSLLARWPGA